MYISQSMKTIQNWLLIKLGELFELKYGKSLVESDRKNGIFPVFGSSGIIGYHNQYIVEGPGIIVGRKGNIGAVYYSTQSFYPIDTVFYINECKEANLKFLYYLLSIEFSKVINTDTAVPGLNRKAALSTNVIIPNSKVTQQKIAGVLAAFDELIEVNRRKIKILEEMAQAVYNEWFVKMRFPGHGKFAPPIGSGDGNAPYRVFDSPLGPIPEGWEVKHIEDICNVVNSGGTPSTKVNECWNGDINWFTTKELNDSYVFESEKTISAHGIKTSSAKIFPTDTIVIAIYGATIGKLAILANASSFNQAACGFVVKLTIYLEYLYMFLYLSRKDLKNLGIGAAQQNISVGLLRKYNIIDPGTELMKEFNNIVYPIFKQIKSLSSIIKNLSSLRDSLLPKLISGKIDVSELDIDQYALGEG